MGKSRKPFHEALVDAINYVSESTDMSEIAVLAQLIKRTKIPAGHDEILAAWNRLCNKFGYGVGSPDIIDVRAALEEQKREAAAQEAAEAAGSAA